MLIVISGNDQILLDKEAKKYIEKKLSTRDTVSYIDDPSLDMVKESIFAQDLFGGQVVYVLRELSEEVYEFIFSKIELFNQSQNTFIALVSKVLKKQKDTCAKAGIDIIEVKSEKEKEMPSFVLADAFLRKDKKAAFVALHTELATKPPEEIHGGLWYQIKNMTLVSLGASEEDSGLHPFVYKKLKTASAKFSKKETEKILTELLRMNHKAHRGEIDFEVALEQFILKFT